MAKKNEVRTRNGGKERSKDAKRNEMEKTKKKEQKKQGKE